MFSRSKKRPGVNLLLQHPPIHETALRKDWNLLLQLGHSNKKKLVFLQLKRHDSKENVCSIATILYNGDRKREKAFWIAWGKTICGGFI